MDLSNGAPWELAKAEIISTEKGELLRDDGDELSYKAKMFDKNVCTKYIFDGDRLVRVLYSLMDRRENLDEYIDDFDDFKMILTMMGTELTSENQWYDEETDASLHVATCKVLNTYMACVLSIDSAGVSCYLECEFDDPNNETSIYMKSTSFNP